MMDAYLKYLTEGESSSADTSGENARPILQKPVYFDSSPSSHVTFPPQKILHEAYSKVQIVLTNICCL